MAFAILYRISRLDNPHSPRLVILQKGKTRFGRRIEHGVSLDTVNQKEISKKHAKVIYHFTHGISEWILKDCRSLNGTFVNYRKISKHILRPLDVIIFGGGAGMSYGDKIDAAADDGCQYVFLLPEIPVKVVDSSSISSSGSISGDVGSDSSIGSKDQDQECAICYASMRRMETLPCGHNFCSRCISKWAKSCIDKMLPAVCPLCRAPFPSSAVSVDYLKRGRPPEIVVPSLGPLKRALGIEKDEELLQLSVCKARWDQEKRSRFWSFFAIIKNNRHNLLVFRYAVSATFRDVFEMSNEELMNVIANLGDEDEYDLASMSSQRLREEAMYIIAKSVNQTVKRKHHHNPNPKF